MSRSAIGWLLIGLGVLIVFLLVVGLGFYWARRRKGRRGADGDALEEIKQQLVWRAMAKGGTITASQAATEGHLPMIDVERALMSMVAEGRAAVEAGEGGEAVYRIDTPTTSSGNEPTP
jgi:hypothetical protein